MHLGSSYGPVRPDEDIVMAALHGRDHRNEPRLSSGVLHRRPGVDDQRRKVERKGEKSRGPAITWRVSCPAMS